MKKTYYYLATLLFVSLVLGSFGQSAFTGKPMYKVHVKRAGIPIGNITIELFPNIAPKHARNFDSLVATGFFDTTAFHRVIPGFVIQGGDPNTRHGPTSTWGFGDPNQPTVNAEFSVAKHLRGIISAARKANNINSATSQFFICVAPAPNLNGQYSVYGRVLGGMDVVDTIVLAPRNAQDRPNLKHEMFVSYLGSNDTVPLAPQLLVPKKDSVGIDSASVLQLKWKAVSDGIIYRLEVSTDSTFASTDTSLDVSNVFSNFVKMAGNTRYYWRVRTNNGGHFSPWSPIWNFHTFGETTGITAYGKEKNKSLVFPNPGNGRFTFEGLRPGSSISVFDETGKLILLQQSSGKTCAINLTDKNKGIYLYRIHLNGKEIDQGKLILR